jgi:hypothetical protein
MSRVLSEIVLNALKPKAFNLIVLQIYFPIDEKARIL